MRYAAFFFAVTLLTTVPARADIVFYVNQQNQFDADTSNLVFLGTEDFESSTLGSGEIGRINDPLAPGVANGPMPFGTQAELGLTLQSNTLAGNAAETSPLGNLGLATYSDGFGESPTDQLIANFSNHSLDMLPAPDSKAISFLPIFVDATGNPNLRGNIEVEVYDRNNILVAARTVNDVSFLLTDVEIGIVATGNSTIGRINLYDGSIADWQGVDDVSIYQSSSVPEPSHATALMLCLSGFCVRLRKSKNG